MSVYREINLTVSAKEFRPWSFRTFTGGYLGNEPPTCLCAYSPDYPNQYMKNEYC